MKTQLADLKRQAQEMAEAARASLAEDRKRLEKLHSETSGTKKPNISINSH
jgi:hypothetical protein